MLHYTLDRGSLDAPQKGESCDECRGTGSYTGLNKVEPCKKCGGRGNIGGEPQSIYENEMTYSCDGVDLDGNPTC